MTKPESQFTYTENPKEQKSTTQISQKPLIGKIANQIGTGANAKDSFIWMSITWSFYISSGLSIAVFLKSCFIIVPEGQNVMTAIKDIWSIFTPIITLALGYAFGKGQ